MQVINT